MTTTYSRKWRDRVRSGAQQSANALVSLLIERFRPSTIIDVGCGEGWFRDEFRDRGVEAVGIDGGWVEGPDHVADLNMGFPDVGTYDLAVCLEVGEHLRSDRAKAFVGWLCELAPVVVFSAAIPKQGGTGHINEQWPEYWRTLFDHFGYVGTGALRWEIWNDDRIESWYRQNLLVFAEHSGSLAPHFGAWNDCCPAVVHPAIWNLYRR